MRVKVNKSSFSSTPTPQSSTSTPTQLPKFKPAIVLSSLQSSLSKERSKIHWDNACSYNVTNDPNLLRQMKPIPPDTFRGVGGSGSATQVGYLPFMPSINFLNICYYAPDFPQTLLSLGQLHACGGAYESSLTPDAVHIYAIDSDPSSLIDIAPLTPGSNLLPTSRNKLEHSLSKNPSLSYVNPSQEPPPRFPLSLRNFIAQNPYLKPPPKLALPPVMKALVAPLRIPLRKFSWPAPFLKPTSNTPSTTPVQPRPKFLRSFKAIKQKIVQR